MAQEHSWEYVTRHGIKGRSWGVFAAWRRGRMRERTQGRWGERKKGDEPPLCCQPTITADHAISCTRAADFEMDLANLRLAS
jgi:hypothetical protein